MQDREVRKERLSLVQRYRARVPEDVEPAGKTVVRVDQPVFVDDELDELGELRLVPWSQLEPLVDVVAW